MSKPRVAFLGLGIMGSNMARRLQEAGFPLTVYNRNPAKAAPLAAGGATIADSPRQAAAQADVIISMVSDDPAARAVWLGENGALAGAKPGAVVIECSTVTVGWVRELAAAAAARQCEFLDAPVTGSRPQAEAGELNFLVGGSAATLDKVRPVLAAMSKSATLLGPVSSGSQFKLINNFVCAVQISSLAEALAMIEHSDLDRAKAMDVILSGAMASPLVKTLAARMMTPNYTPNFPLHLMTKDVGYAIEEGKRLSVDLVTGKAAQAVFRSAIAAGHGDKDMAAVVEPLRSS
jgi:3-hydroxyisobutyrate dehydrogenase